ncbi:conserved Plasmodium protein, unknown function [Plasmodium ovale]|uniref:Ion transport domain-containing protein n=1 Tax=Plasmodium ovale TaxID=36330 RepID=A0A1D3TMF3_PLAOA|nr:conserved Plasmodium protein, unknown function [Plasmodium ovale]
MDSFIDEEIISADENEPVLLDIKDLLNLKEKNEKKSRKDKHLQIASNSYYIPKMETQDMSDDASTFLIHKEDNERNGNNDKNSVYSSKWGAYYVRLCFHLKSYYEGIVKIWKNIFPNKKKKEENIYYYSNNLSSEFLNILANRLYYSKVTTYLYFFVILVNISILLSTFFANMVSKFVVVSEIFVILMLFVEVCLRLTTQGSNYFYHFDGLFDVTVTTVCFLLLISSGDLKVFYQSSVVKTKNREVEEIISQSLTVLRFSFQLFRTITLFMHYKRTEAPSDNIDFSLLNLPKDDI